jgi:hypothetical protein
MLRKGTRSSAGGSDAKAVCLVATSVYAKLYQERASGYSDDRTHFNQCGMRAAALVLMCLFEFFNPDLVS